MTLYNPNREVIRAAYNAVTGIELMNTLIDLFILMVDRVNDGCIHTGMATIAWNDGTVTINPC